MAAPGEAASLLSPASWPLLPSQRGSSKRLHVCFLTSPLLLQPPHVCRSSPQLDRLGLCRVNKGIHAAKFSLLLTFSVSISHHWPHPPSRSIFFLYWCPWLQTLPATPQSPLGARLSPRGLSLLLFLKALCSGLSSHHLAGDGRTLHPVAALSRLVRPSSGQSEPVTASHALRPASPGSQRVGLREGGRDVAPASLLLWGSSPVFPWNNAAPTKRPGD